MHKNKEDSKMQESVALIIKTISYFYKFAYKEDKSYFLIVFFSALLKGVAPFLNIIIPKLLIDELLGDKEMVRLVSYVLMITLGNTILFIINKWITETINIYGDKFARAFSFSLSNRIMEMDFEHTEDPDMLNLYQKASTGMSWYSGGIAGLTNSIIDIVSLIMTLSGVTLLIILDVPILLILIVVNVLLSMYFNTKRNKIDVKYFNKLAGINRAFGYIYWELPGFQYGKDIRLYQATDMVLDKGEANNDATAQNWRQQAKETRIYSQGDIVVGGIRDMITFIYLGAQAIGGAITIGGFTMLTSAANTLSGSLSGIIWNIQELHKKSVYMNEYVTFMEKADSMTQGHRRLAIDKNKSYEIEFRDVSFSYPRTNEKILDKINLTLHAGERLAVVGLNGAGKTTFIKLLCRLYDVTEGEILLNGVNIKEYQYDDYMKLFSVVFQDFKLLSFSIIENVILSEEDTMEDTVMEYIGQCGLSEKVKTLKNGIKTSVNKQYDEDGIELSGGEAQKLAITRALYKQAPIVVLDEPTAALDPRAEAEIYQQFNNLIKGKTAVYISHRLSSCKFCDCIAVFSEGKVKEYGTHDTLIALSNGIYHQMFMAQAQYYNE